MKGDTMRKDYAHNQKADLFGLGFEYNGYVYGFLADLTCAMHHAKADKTSKKRGRISCLRLRISADDKDYYANDDMEPLCTVAEFKAMRKPGENRGHVFERLLCEKYNATPCKIRAWWEGADFTLPAGDKVQAKFEGGTFCTAKQCRAIR